MYHSVAAPSKAPLAFYNAIMTNAHKKYSWTKMHLHKIPQLYPFSFYSVDTLIVRYIVRISPRLTEKKRRYYILLPALLCKQNSVFSKINCNENIFSIIAKKSLQPKAFHNTRTYLPTIIYVLYNTLIKVKTHRRRMWKTWHRTSVGK